MVKRHEETLSAKKIYRSNKHIKRCSTSVAISEIKLKSQWDIKSYPLDELKFKHSNKHMKKCTASLVVREIQIETMR
jgi:hypothetical protein